MAWEAIAKLIETNYGDFVDWDERFWNCPECEEPIYEADWDDNDLITYYGMYMCPVCEETIK